MSNAAIEVLKRSAVFEAPVFGFDEMIRTHACHRGNEAAFIDGESVLTWREFERRVSCVAESLARAGIRKGERVAMLASNSFWAYEVMFGIARAGAVVTSLSLMLTPALLAKLLADSDAQLLFAGRGCEQLATDAAAVGGGKPRVIRETGVAGAPDSFEAFIAGTHGVFTGPDPKPLDTFGIIYSSGTTGVPKGIMHSHAGRFGMAWHLGAALAIPASARCLLATPPSSNGTMIVLLPAIIVGAACVLTRTLSPDDFFGALSRHRFTHAFMVPTQFAAIFTDERAQHADFSGVRCLLSAGAPLAPQLKRILLERIGHCFHELWGFTEGVATLIGPEEARQRPQSVGRALPGTDLRVIDENGKELQPPATGELVGRSVMLMQGYLNRPDANEEIRWLDAHGTTFLRTGDIGAIDEEGFVTLRGRIKDMILSGGLNVYPSDIEPVLLEHPAVADAAVIGVPHEKWGEAPLACVIAKPGVALDPVALREWANARVARHQRLVDVVLRTEDFPRNALGKVLKAQLRAALVAAEAPR